MKLLDFLKEEITVIKERDPAIKSTIEVFLYPSLHVMIRYRIAHWFYIRKKYFVARWISQRAVRKTGIEIHPGATIGRGLFIDHGSGVVIGETCEIGDDVTIYQGVTLGGTGKEVGKRHPTIGNNVMISAGAKILGSIVIGDDCKIGSGSVVLKDIPENSTVVGIPGRIVKINNEKINHDKIVHPRSELDQVHFPDPVRMEMCKLRIRIECLEKGIKGLTDEDIDKMVDERCKKCKDNVNR